MTIDRFCSATAASQQLKAGDITPQQLKDTLLEGIATDDTKIKSFLFTDNAPSPVRPNSLLGGLPISVKDQYHIADTPCSFGMQEQPISSVTAPVISTLLEQGATLLGKTSLPPFAMDFQTNNKRLGFCNNPWNVDYTSGGSSGGGAAAVAAAMSFADIGSDLAGSLRIPASFCGVYSLLPSEGALSNQGMFVDPDEQIAHFARPGPIVRTAEDLRLLWQGLSGKGKDVTSLDTDELARPLRIAFWKALDELPLDLEISQAMDNALTLWQEAGVSLQQDKPENFNFNECWRWYGQIMGYEIAGLLNIFQRWLSILTGGAYSRLSPHFFANVIKGYRRNASHYGDALSNRQRLIAHSEAFFQHYDAWVLPVTCCKVFKHMAPTSEHGPNRTYQQPLIINGLEVNYLDALTAYTTPISLIGHPVVTMPIGVDQHGMPIGIQLVGKMNGEEQLIAVAEKLSQHISMPRCPSWL
ncbi:amidase [Motilimonas eburnea]|uniref:amidase n=1 Tax=Motilimonas eburnea TaxID=1737488 RepID=UPI001E611ADC|nr:amidase [Motilimonas eburnea]MCE2573306.1 amidase [Motilimonas eburnea]